MRQNLSIDGKFLLEKKHQIFPAFHLSNKTVFFGQMIHLKPEKLILYEINVDRAFMFVSTPGERL